MTLRAAHRAGYRIPDLAWLRMRELECLGLPEVEEASTPLDEESAFTF